MSSSAANMSTNRDGQTVEAKWFDKFTAELPPTLAGKTIAVTGCTTGTGRVMCDVVARRGAKVVMLNRPSERADAALEAVKAVATGEVVFVPCDLQDFASVRSAAATIATECPEGLDVLCNNAGIMCVPNKATKDGYCREIQTNHLSHFLLTAEVWPLLEKAADERGDARVVNHSSGASQLPFFFLVSGFQRGFRASYFGKDMSPSKVGGEDTFQGKFRRYGQTKYANLIFTHALATRQSKVKAIAAHPGICVSELTVHQKKGATFMDRLFKQSFDKMQQATEDGTMGILSAALMPDAKTDQVHGPKAWGQVGPVVRDDIVPYGIKRGRAESAVKGLWKVSVEATGATFPFEVC